MFVNKESFDILIRKEMQMDFVFIIWKDCRGIYSEVIYKWPVPVAAWSNALACRDYGFESHRGGGGHGCLSDVSVVCCQVEVCATS